MITKTYLVKLINSHAPKRKRATFVQVMNEALTRKMLVVLPKNLTEKKRKKMISDEYLIREGKDIIVSGGARIGIFFMVSESTGDLKRMLKQGHIEQFREQVYIMRKLDYFKIKVNDLDKDKVLWNKD